MKLKKITSNHYTIVPIGDDYLQVIVVIIFEGWVETPLEPPESALAQIQYEIKGLCLSLNGLVLKLSRLT